MQPSTHEPDEKRPESPAPTQTVNGLDRGAIFQTLDAVKGDPELAEFQFRLANEWCSGGQNRSTFSSFHGTKQELRHAKTFTEQADEPPVLLGQDAAPNPVEHLLHALTSCVTTSMVVHAAARGLSIDALESRVEGDIDLRGFLGVSPDVPKGYRAIRMTFRLRGDFSDEQLDEIVRAGPQYSPVFNSVSPGVPISVRGERF